MGSNKGELSIFSALLPLKVKVHSVAHHCLSCEGSCRKYHQCRLAGGIAYPVYHSSRCTQA